MTKKQFWRIASNWGLICGAALFAVSLVAWGGKMDANNLGAEAGYPYSRAVGFVFAMMLFAGIVWGVGEFLMANYIARDYYDAVNASRLDAAMHVYSGTALEGQMMQMRDMMVRMMSNPFFLILNGVVNFLIKGGFLGLVMCAFLKKNPDMFGGANNAAGSDDAEGSDGSDGSNVDNYQR